MTNRILSLFYAALIGAVYALIFFAVWLVAQFPDLRLILIVGVIVGLVAGGFALIAVMGASVFQDRDNE